MTSNALRHGHNRKGQRTPTYRAWAAAKNRCTNSRNVAYGDYGGRGITFHQPWLDFAVFLADMGARPEGSTLERLKNHLGYFPRNCVWATRKAQARNRRSSHFVTIGGQRKTVAEWCEINGLRQQTAQQRIHGYGWPPKRAVTEPARHRSST